MRFAPIVLALVCAPGIWGQEKLSDEQRKLNIDSFEQVYKTISERHWDQKLLDSVWKPAHDELRPKVESAATNDEARAVIRSMLERLKQTHFGIVSNDVYKDLDSPSGPRDGSPGLDLRVIDGRALVISVEPGSSAQDKGVKMGWQVVRVEDREVEPAIQRLQKQFEKSTMLDLVLARSILGRMNGPIGSTVRVTFLDGQDKSVPLELTRAALRGKLARLGNMPPIYFWAEGKKLHGDVGYVRFNAFFEPEDLTKTFETTVKDCASCKGFVIDLRGNPGGIGGLAMGAAGWFFEKAGQQLGTMYLRGNNLKFAVFPRVDTFKGPLAILIDGCSASSSEIFAGGMQDLKRARIFGTRTAGAALPSVFDRLPNGDGFQYAIANYISEGGKPLEGLGVTPDERVQPTRHQLLENQDEVLGAALQWIEKQKK